MECTLDEMIATLPPARQKAIQRRAAELISEELSLCELRKMLELTQTEVARRLKKGQEVIFRLERRQDLLLSTLQDYVESLGGELGWCVDSRAGRRCARRIVLWNFDPLMSLQSRP